MAFWYAGAQNTGQNHENHQMLSYNKRSRADGLWHITKHKHEESVVHA